jgi:hypothetical protein
VFFKIFLPLNLLCLLTLGISGKNLLAQEVTQALHISGKSYNFGNVAEGTKILTPLTLYNRGSYAVTVTDIVTDCGCVVLEKSKGVNFPLILNPGQFIELEIKLSTQGLHGYQRKDVTILSSDQVLSTQIFSIRGTIKPAFIVTPAQVDFGNIVDVSKPTLLTVSKISSDRIYIRSLSRELSIKLVKSTPTLHSYSLQLRDIENKTGQFNGHLYIELVRGKKKLHQIIPITAIFKTVISFKPQVISLGILEPNKNKKFEVTGTLNLPASSRGSVQRLITEVNPDSSAITLVKTIVNESTIKISGSVDSDKITTLDFNSKISIEIEGEETQFIKVSGFKE